jgi:hypothetical protein
MEEYDDEVSKNCQNCSETLQWRNFQEIYKDSFSSVKLQRQKKQQILGSG